MTSIQELLKKKNEGRKVEAKIKAVEEATALDEAGQQQVRSIIDQNQVVVFSKSYCPYCRQAKMTFNSIENLEYKAVEMDDGAHDGWQGFIAELAKTKALECAANNNTKSVPQIFINQTYIGGAEDLADLYTNGELAEMLGRLV